MIELEKLTKLIIMLSFGKNQTISKSVQVIIRLNWLTRESLWMSHMPIRLYYEVTHLKTTEQLLPG